MKKKLWLAAAAFAVIALLFAACNNSTSPSTTTDTRVALTAGAPVSADVADTSAQATFTGADGLSLAKEDFTVTTDSGTGTATVSAVSVAGTTVTVTITFADNSSATGSDPNIFIVGIANDSAKIKGSATVKVTQFGMAPAASNAELLTYNVWNPGEPGVYEFKGDNAAPNNVGVFLDSRFLVIKSVGGGLGNGFDERGFGGMQFKIDATVDGWDSDIAYYQIQNTLPDRPSDWFVSFPHSETDVVYFVYDLSVYKQAYTDGGITVGDPKSVISITYGWAGAEQIFGTFEAYITSADLTMGASDAALVQDSGQAGVPEGDTFGWITKNPVGLVLPD